MTLLTMFSKTSSRLEDPKVAVSSMNDKDGVGAGTYKYIVYVGDGTTRHGRPGKST